MRISRFIQKDSNYVLYLIQQTGGKSQKRCRIRRDTPSGVRARCADLCTVPTLQKRMPPDNIPALPWLN